MNTRTTPITAPATPINTGFVILFFEFVGLEEELSEGRNNKHVGEKRYYAISYTIPCLTN